MLNFQAVMMGHFSSKLSPSFSENHPISSGEAKLRRAAKLWGTAQKHERWNTAKNPQKNTGILHNGNPQKKVQKYGEAMSCQW